MVADNISQGESFLKKNMIARRR